MLYYTRATPRISYSFAPDGGAVRRRHNNRRGDGVQGRPADVNQTRQRPYSQISPCRSRGRHSSCPRVRADSSRGDGTVRLRSRSTLNCRGWYRRHRPERAASSTRQPNLGLQCVPKASAMAPAPREARSPPSPPPMPREPRLPSSPPTYKHRVAANDNTDESSGARERVSRSNEELPPEGLMIRPALPSVHGGGPAAGESHKREQRQDHNLRSDVGTIGVLSYAFQDPCEDPAVQDQLLHDMMTSPGQLIFLQSVPPQIFDRIKDASSGVKDTAAEGSHAETKRRWAQFIVDGDKELGVAVMGRTSVFARVSLSETKTFDNWALWCGTFHFKQPLCNIVAIPVATVVAHQGQGGQPVPASASQAVMEFLTQRDVRVVGIQFSTAVDVPYPTSDMHVLAWQPYKDKVGDLAFVAPAVICAMGPIASVRRLHELGDRATWPVHTLNSIPPARELSGCPKLNEILAAPPNASCCEGMQVLPCSIEKRANVQFPQAIKLMVFFGRSSRRGGKRWDKKPGVKGNSSKWGTAGASARGSGPPS